ncbi:MAG: hypothetical protein ACD_7C00397G0003 [uncultured bacterium]|nr:MAG: hypothetical protein ACD_7C00397G0003 [uncultured bacterium]KKP69225.1 MAG: hypothetical protein UR66_C0001G0107 [Candidatus Moranbacteria bacterium GW2011_GWE1_35_17]KKP73123.1 MAG: hypothetical protein UR65_C0007G0009 [Candidatus Moranbacteria bacterium GW2011_GWE2_35_164]KKP85173.1 MAG: hypothetical protein UR83_C0003G0008 [Candidatus Moranbacteria bacterium GW2011_GWF2_35_54]OGS62822.1 MAG: hypothetical protein A2X07_10875 [Flavobacteria bacterium GWF1_32_7]
MKNNIFEEIKTEKFCRHDYKNAIQIGNVDHVCPLCKDLLDPLEWFFMNNFEFVDATSRKSNKKIKSHE